MFKLKLNLWTYVWSSQCTNLTDYAILVFKMVWQKIPVYNTDCYLVHLCLQVAKKVFISTVVLAVFQIIILVPLIVTLRVHRSKSTESYLCFEDKYMNISTSDGKLELMKHKAYLFENEASRQVCVGSSVVFTDIVSKVNGHDYF